MSRSAERVKGPGPRSVGDNDGDSPALLATTATVRAFPPWPATGTGVSSLACDIDDYQERCPADQRGQKAGPNTHGLLDL